MWRHDGVSWGLIVFGLKSKPTSDLSDADFAASADLMQVFPVTNQGMKGGQRSAATNEVALLWF